MTQPNRAEFVAGLRQVADWLEAHPEVDHFDPCINIYTMNSKDEAVAVGRAFRTFEKTYTDDYFNIIKSFGAIQLRYIFQRGEICTKHVVGTKSIPDYYSPGHLVPAHDEEVVEWDCGSLLESDLPEPEVPQNAVDEQQQREDNHEEIL